MVGTKKDSQMSKIALKESLIYGKIGYQKMKRKEKVSNEKNCMGKSTKSLDVFIMHGTVWRDT